MTPRRFLSSSVSKVVPLLLLLPAAWPAVAGAQSISLAVDATQKVRTVDDRVFGLNTAVWSGTFKDAQTQPLLKAIDTRILRFPGGSTSDVYDWKNKRNTQDGSSFTNSWNVDFDQFAATTLSLNAQAFITVNYGSGTPEEAAEWVAYSNVTKGYGFKYWEIGNENYGSWEYDIHPVKWDPVTYATLAKEFIAKMKAVDPSIKIGVVAQTGEDSLDSRSPVHNVVNPRTTVTHRGWTPVMLATLKSLGVTPDYLIYHRYEQAPAADRPTDPEGDAKLLQAAKTWPLDAADLRQQLTDYLGATEGNKVELAVTENNSVYAKPGKQTTNLVNGLYYADSLGNILQTEFSSFVWWDLHNGRENGNNNNASLYGWRNYGDYGVLSTTNQPYPTYYVMKLLTHFARGGDTVVRATSSNTLLSVFAVRRADGSLRLLVLNKDPINTLNATIALTGHTAAPVANVYSYGIPQDEAARTGVGSADVATSTLAVGGATFAASFAPYSATVVSLADNSPTPVISLQPQSQNVSASNSVTFSVGAGGAGTLSYQWRKNGVAIPGATNPNFTINAVQLTDAAAYTVVVTSGTGSVTSAPAFLAVSAPTPNSDARVANLSTRAFVGTGADVLIPGIAIAGSGQKQLIVRASGPALAAYNVSGVLAQPQLRLYNGSTEIASNIGWSSGGSANTTALQTAFAQVGLPQFPNGSADCALLATVNPGGYTAIVSGVGNTTGVALVEVYELGASSARQVAISCRAWVGTGGDVLIPGITIAGTGPKQIIIRAAGPALTVQGVSGVLAQPYLEVFGTAGKIAENTGWSTSANVADLRAATTACGLNAFPAGSADCAILLTLEAGSYTAKVSGLNNTTGVALIEVYEVP
ncbi:MAG TPA: immunoglobulin domain-containing protein [Opitutaceae bacterium]|nr:immunoglobulin domain-containing protein [Opitutaceae bacterium]